jgi:glycosyltransferase involved in cell wall biosynthesis
MRVLALTRYGDLGASTRLRTLQYVPLLRDAGIDVDVSPLFVDAYLEFFYRRGRAPLLVSAAGYLRRLAALTKQRAYDLVWLEKELLPWLPAAFERMLRPPYLVDYDDAIFHRYDQHPAALVRSLLGRKIDLVMRRAAVVVVGNRYLADAARRVGAREIEIIPTSVDTDRYRPVAKASVEGPSGDFNVGWIGTPQTAPFLRTLTPAFERLHESGGFRFTFIGAPADLDVGVPFDALPWTEGSEVSLLQRLDCGIMPLPDLPFERGKSGYKLIQYMACGLPVVASPVGENRHIVREGVNGLLASQTNDWVAALHRLRDAADRGRSLGLAGREMVEATYDCRRNAKRLAAVLGSAAGR